jgi:hypothetical protein
VVISGFTVIAIPSLFDGSSDLLTADIAGLEKELMILLWQ